MMNFTLENLGFQLLLPISKGSRFKCLQGSFKFSLIEICLCPNQACPILIGLAEFCAGFSHCRDELIELPFGIFGVAGFQQVLEDHEIGVGLIRLKLNSASCFKSACPKLSLALEEASLIQVTNVLNFLLAHFDGPIAAPCQGQSNGSGEQ